MTSLPEFDPTGFSGTAALFPLPGTVLFPHMTAPLHIFEPRYRKMVSDALAGEGLIAMSLLAPGWEANYEGRPPIYEMTCLGRIVAHERLPGGKFNLMLQGLLRAVVVEELSPDEPYRVARLELYRDVYLKKPAIDRARRSRELILGVRRLFQNTEAHALVARLLDAEIPLGELCDILAGVLRCDVPTRQELLEEVGVDQRSDLLLTSLRRQLSAAGREAIAPVFPPAFSMN